MAENTHPHTFTLLAPHQKQAFIQLDIFDWEKKPMKKNERGEFYFNTELPDGEYRYRFHVPSTSWFYEENTWVDIVDPLATQVDEENHAAVLRFQNGFPVHSHHAWQHDHVDQRPVQEWVLYELHPGIFGAHFVEEAGETAYRRGTFLDLIDKIDYLKKLGITAVQLMPIQEFPGKDSMGYNPAYFLAPESAYGLPEHLMQFIDTLHGQRMSCIGDFVFNHASDQSPLAQMDHDYWFHREPKDEKQSWGPEFNYHYFDECHQRHPAWEHALHTVRHWLFNYHLDGLRYDAVKQINHRDFLDWLTQQTQENAGPKHFFNIAECIPDEPSMVAGEGPMDACWHDGFCHDIRQLLSGQDIDSEQVKNALDGTRKGYETPLQIVNYLSNHDQPRLQPYFMDLGLSAEEAVHRHQLGVALLCFAVGIPMIRMGEEMAWHMEGDETRGVLPWSDLEDETVNALWQSYRFWIHERHQHADLQQGQMRFFESAAGWICGRFAEDAASLLLFNPSDIDIEIVLDFSGELAGEWQESSQGNITEGHFQLRPWSYVYLRRQR